MSLLKTYVVTVHMVTDSMQSIDGLHWQSLSMPASLPITCSYFPTYDILGKRLPELDILTSTETKHTEFPHMVTPLIPHYKDSPLLLLTELIALRLDQHYQIVTFGVDAANSLPYLPEASEALLDKAVCIALCATTNYGKVYMSTHDSFVVLYIDNCNNIRVRNFLRNKLGDGLFTLNRRNKATPQASSHSHHSGTSTTTNQFAKAARKDLPEVRKALFTTKNMLGGTNPNSRDTSTANTTTSTPSKITTETESTETESLGGITITPRTSPTTLKTSETALNPDFASGSGDAAGSGNWSAGSQSGNGKSRLAQRAKDAVLRLTELSRRTRPNGEAPNLTSSNNAGVIGIIDPEVEREEVRGKYEYQEGQVKKIVD